ncbi:ABC transporter permease [Micromonospora profundi]|uniref:ABC transporter permease n=1 Tax=Micromonospora TaxID=1873 RepID=UPI00339F1E0D
MRRIIWAQLRRRAGRTLAMFFAIVTATIGFVVLTGNTRTSQLTVAGEVNAHFRGSYDILVRPTGSRSALESDRGLLRPNFLSSRYGGITLDQWRGITKVRDVEVAAPIGNLGYSPFFAGRRFDLTALVDRSATRQLIRQRRVWSADRGLTVAEESPELVYVTKRPVIRPVDEDPVNGTQKYADGRTRRNPCPDGIPPPVLEVREDGDEVPLCLASGEGTRRRPALVVELDADGLFHYPSSTPGQPSPRLDPLALVMMSYSVAAIDPDSEAKLVGLDSAMTFGRYLEPDRSGGERRRFDGPVNLVPAIGTAAPQIDEKVFVRAERVTADPSAGDLGRLAELADAAPAEARLDTPPVDSVDAQQSARTDGTLYFAGGLLSRIGRSGAVEYQVDPDGTLRPEPRRPAGAAWTEPVGAPPQLWNDTALRETTMIRSGDRAGANQMGVGLDPIGFFDPTRLTQRDPLAETPMETYDANVLRGARTVDRELLGDQPLSPNSNPGGYHSPPPAFLVSLNSLAALTGETAPISAVRVRVAGIDGFNSVSRERVRRVADDISRATGLDVEVTLGASPSAQTVVLPAGRYGRPELRLSEGWTRKGVSATIAEAVDRKSLVLFGLILVVCVLFLVNAVSAAVRERHRELALLSCLGWSRARLVALLTGETMLLGVLAGAVSSVLAVPLGLRIGTDVGWDRALWAIPVAGAVALVAGLVPAWRASAAAPFNVVRRSGRKVTVKLGHGRAGVLRLAIANLLRVPGRTALGCVALAAGVAGLTLLMAIVWTFQGAVSGSILGEAVSLRVRGADVLAVVLTVLLGLMSVVDVLYLNIRERAGELAILRASGWSRSSVRRLVGYEGVGIGVLGALAGAATGCVAAAWFAGVLDVRLLWTTAAVALAGVVLAGLAALVPVMLLDRLPLAGQLSAD